MGSKGEKFPLTAPQWLTYSRPLIFVCVKFLVFTEHWIQSSMSLQQTWVQIQFEIISKYFVCALIELVWRNGTHRRDPAHLALQAG